MGCEGVLRRESQVAAARPAEPEPEMRTSTSCGEVDMMVVLELAMESGSRSVGKVR